MHTNALISEEMSQQCIIFKFWDFHINFEKNIIFLVTHLSNYIYLQVRKTHFFPEYFLNNYLFNK